MPEHELIWLTALQEIVQELHAVLDNNTAIGTTLVPAGMAQVQNAF